MTVMIYPWIIPGKMVKSQSDEDHLIVSWLHLIALHIDYSIIRTWIVMSTSKIVARIYIKKGCKFTLLSLGISSMERMRADGQQHFFQPIKVLAKTLLTNEECSLRRFWWWALLYLYALSALTFEFWFWM